MTCASWFRYLESLVYQSMVTNISNVKRCRMKMLQAARSKELTSLFEGVTQNKTLPPPSISLHRTLESILDLDMIGTEHVYSELRSHNKSNWPHVVTRKDMGCVSSTSQPRLRQHTYIYTLYINSFSRYYRQSFSTCHTCTALLPTV